MEWQNPVHTGTHVTRWQPCVGPSFTTSIPPLLLRSLKRTTFSFFPHLSTGTLGNFLCGGDDDALSATEKNKTNIMESVTVGNSSLLLHHISLMFIRFTSLLFGSCPDPSTSIVRHLYYVGKTRRGWMEREKNGIKVYFFREKDD